MDKIRDWLYIGKYRDTQNQVLLSQFGIQAMLQFAEEVKQPGIITLYLPIEDGVLIPPNLLQEGIQFALDQRTLGHPLLISCGAGMSRSASFCLIALMKTEKINLLAALKEVKTHHPDTMIHPVLWTSLCEFCDEQVTYLDAMKIMNTSVM